MARSGPDKEKCGAQLPNKPPGVTCRNVAGERTDHLGVGRCYRHGGATQSHEKAAAVEILRQTADRLGISRQVDPAEALLELVWEAAGNVEFYRSLVESLPIHPEDDSLVTGEDGIAHWKAGAPGIYGRTYHVSGIPTGEAKRVILVQMYDDERDRLERYVKDALAAKIDERRVQIAERDARELFSSVGRAMTAAQLSPEQAETFRRELANDLRRPNSAQLAC